MEIIDNKALLIRTKYPSRITETIKQSQHLGDGQVLVKWSLENAQTLKQLGFKKTPSPIDINYSYPGFGKPFAHQRDMASFMSLHKKCFNFSDMGVGKTRAAIWAADYLMSVGAIKRVLVISPLSVMRTAWEADIYQTAIHRTVGIAHGSREARRKIIDSGVEFVIINHDGVKVMAKELASANFELVIVDEATSFKEQKTDRWKALRTIVRSETYLWMMTGTPAANKPLDAYGLAKLVNPNGVPKFYTGWKELTMYKVSMFTWLPRVGATEIVHAALQPAIRISKKDCMDLPPVVYQTREIPMSPTQEKYYKRMKAEMLMNAANEQITAVNAGVLLNKLLQISAGAVYSDTGEVVEFKPTARLNELLDVINECSNKVLVYAAYRHSFDVIGDFLTKHNITYGLINGSVPNKDRATLITRFQNDDDIKVLLLQPQAAAHGITLTAADTTVWFTPVPSLELWAQANARMDRPGQKNNMTIVKLVGSPVEEKLYKVLESRGSAQKDLLELYRSEIST